ncbi:MAG: L,D-transpeptidase/peptidoglycan binding protein [Propionibacterium sp.]|nr:L,D-transpeptidase/peptidoglycan binding protein [Propionibacterium sp.]
MASNRVSSKMKWLLGGVLAFVLLVGGASAGYAAHFAQRGLPGVSVAGTSVTGQTRDEVAQAVSARAGELTVTVNVDGEPTTAKLADLGVTVDADATAAKAFEPNASAWSRLKALFDHRDVSVVTSVDEAKLQAFGQEVSAKAGSAATDATVVLSEDGSQFVATPAASGVGVDVSQLTGVVSTAASTLSSQTVDLQASEVAPKVSTEAAQAAAEKANGLLALDVTITDGITDYTASAQDKAQWVNIPADGSEDAAPAFDDAKVTAWVEKVAGESNEDPEPGIKNVNSRGDVVAVASPGKNGWKTNNVPSVAKAVVEALHKGESYSGDFDYDKVEPTFTTREIADGAENLVYKAAPGEKWIDLNLSNYTVTAYEGATIVQGPMYMVPGEPDTPTVAGTFHVYLKYETQTMRGENKDGSKYVTPDVPYVTYFTGSYAFHGAPWRSSFGWGGPGGSHGCVNMPVDAAKWIYDWSEIGTTVVSHY